MKQLRNIFAIITIICVLIAGISPALAKPRGSAPSTPSGLKAASITSSDITLSWYAVNGATGYKIYKASPNDSNYTLLTTITNTTFKDTNLTSSTNYWYYVQAYNSYGTSSGSTHLKVTTAAAPAPIPEPTPTPTTKTVLGFTTYYYSGDSSSYNSMVNNSSLIDEIATETYKTDSTGNITGLVPTNQLTYANSNGIKAFTMLTNNFDGNIAKSVLESPTNRQNLINNIVTQLKANGYKGINVDLEGVFYYDRSYYTAFMNELYNTLKPLGYTVTVAVPAKTSDSPTNTWAGAYDYASLANYADQVVLMTYDEHYPGGQSGPVASIGWVESVIKYASSVIPKEKILLGTAAYGYDWSSNGTKAYGISGIYNLAATYGSTIMWDDATKCSYFNYTDASGVNHTVWFEDAKSLSYKLDLVNNYNLSGIGIWRLGLENTDYWNMIKTKFNK